MVSLLSLQPIRGDPGQPLRVLPTWLRKVLESPCPGCGAKALMGTISSEAHRDAARGQCGETGAWRG